MLKPRGARFYLQRKLPLRPGSASRSECFPFFPFFWPCLSISDHTKARNLVEMRPCCSHTSAAACTFEMQKFPRGCAPGLRFRFLRRRFCIRLTCTGRLRRDSSGNFRRDEITSELLLRVLVLVFLPCIKPASSNDTKNAARKNACASMCVCACLCVCVSERQGSGPGCILFQSGTYPDHVISRRRAHAVGPPDGELCRE